MFTLQLAVRDERITHNDSIDISLLSVFFFLTACFEAAEAADDAGIIAPRFSSRSAAPKLSQGECRGAKQVVSIRCIAARRGRRDYK